MHFKNIVLLVLLLLGENIVKAQSINTNYNIRIKDTTYPYANYGSATKLKGSTLIVNYFVSSGKNDWKLAEKEFCLQRQKEAIEWLKGEGNYFGHTLSFAVSTIGLQADIKLEKLAGGNFENRKRIRMVPYVLYAAGVSNLFEYYDSINNLNKYDHVVIQIFANKDGRSYAQKSNTNTRTSENFLEGCVIYKQWNDVDVSAATIAHELLHCFGAVDIYTNYNQDEALLQKIKYIFSKSIMLNTHRPIKPLQIDQLTAWCIGWDNDYYGWYNYFTNRYAVGTH